MGLIVQKYGGTSLADSEKIKNAARRIVKEREQGNDVVVVVSAMGKTTDDLLALAYEITDKPNPREIDMLLATGEQISIALVAMAVQSLGYPAISFTGPQVGIITNRVHQRARITNINIDKIQTALQQGQVVIVAGFQGASYEGEITTLGRGGSDTTAVALAARLGADVCEILTDVDGVYTADPRIVKNAKLLSKISYDEMLELAGLGARVLHSRSVELAKNFNVPLHVRSTFNSKPGTMVVKEVPEMEDIVVSGVAYNRNEVKLSILGVPDRPGIAAELFGALADANVVVDMIIQNVAADNMNDISFTVGKEDFETALKVTQEVARRLKAKDVIYDKDIAKVSVVGVGMKSHCGVAATMFRALAKQGINIEMISTSEIKISCVIKGEWCDKAVQAVHSEFELELEKAANVPR
ncbi:aspartate kinase [Candidatus Sumerlaeota bacterium]|nr:aspartate kinase [Candidatus Sumerlaeota bacterium]